MAQRGLSVVRLAALLIAVAESSRLAQGSLRVLPGSQAALEDPAHTSDWATLPWPRLHNRTTSKFIPASLACLQEMSVQVRDRHRGVEAVYSRSNSMSGFMDGIPTPYTSPNGKKFLVCMTEKSGSTRWKQLFLKGLGVTDFQQPHGYEMRGPDGEVIWPVYWEAPAMAKSPLFPRIMIVRDPYTRLLSAYLSKVARPNKIYDSKNTFGMPRESSLLDVVKLTPSPADFGAFVMALSVHVRASGFRGVNKHFQPLHHKCGLMSGMHHDLVLKVEEMDIWYKDLITLMGLEAVASSGWQAINSLKRPQRGEGVTEEANDCFYRRENQTCMAMARELFSPIPSAMCPPQAAHGANAASPHHVLSRDYMQRGTAASDKVKLYYTPETARLVSEMYAGDLRSFDYPLMKL